ncbi:MAG: NAD(+) synthase [Candidatus Eremiobacteraeota bacterium]|nr:NAD(+) synthase [Candidatus Eremiobacteraeota bacterium]
MRVRVAAAALNQTPLDWDNNLHNIRGAIRQARAQQASILCLPELCITGYGCEDAFLSPAVQRTAWDVLQELLPDTQGMVVSLGLPLMVRKAVYNCAALVADGRILGFVAKMNLAGDGIHYEPRWFKPWPAGVKNHVVTPQGEFPVGDLIFELSGLRLGFEICEDAWVATRPGASLAGRAVDIILNPSASHFAFRKQAVRERFVLEGSRAFGVGYVYANLLGNEAGRALYDGSTIIASGGQLVANGARFRFGPGMITCATLDIQQNRMGQARLFSYRPNLQEEAEVRHSFGFPPLPPALETPEHEDWENGPHEKEEEFTRAQRLALWDYMRKSRSRGFVLSLSGGADSSAIACLIHYMVHSAWNELGPEQFNQTLWPGCQFETPEAAIKEILITVYQATRNSGDVTQQAAASLSEALGGLHYEFDVDAMVEGYKAMVAGAIGRSLDWQRDDIALQNIQARVRAPGVWMLANLRGALLLSTSNRSEAAVGYATMDGDTSGGLSPIAGIDKNYLRHWLRWVESDGPADLGPIAAISVVNAQQPTAELRPPESKQTDEDDLMPYDLLDAVEKAAIRDKQSPLECYQQLQLQFPQYTARQLCTWVERFFQLFCRNQWKRERYAPSFHLDDENLDPKSWCRFPILSGSYARELKELRHQVQTDVKELW